MGRFQVDDSSISNQLQEEKKEKERRKESSRGQSPDGPHLEKKNFFFEGKKMSGVFMSTTYSPRYEFVTTKFLTQIRIYRVYTEDRQIFLAQKFSSSLTFRVFFVWGVV